MAICAIVLVAVNAVFATAIRLRDRTSAGVDEGLPIERTMESLRRDLKGAVGPRGFLAGDFRCGTQAVGATMGLSGEAGGAGLDFFSATGSIGEDAPWGDIQEVLYELKAPADRTQGGMDLVRCVNRNILAVTTQVPRYSAAAESCRDRHSLTAMTALSGATPGILVRVIPTSPPQSELGSNCVAKPGEDASKKSPLEMLVPLITVTRTNQVATMSSP
jgi:hypothetical protein